MVFSFTTILATTSGLPSGTYPGRLGDQRPKTLSKFSFLVVLNQKYVE